MANTKDTLIVVGTALDEAKFASGRTVTTAEIAKYGLTLAAADNATGFVTGEVADSAGAISTQDDKYTLNAYAAATQGVMAITFTNVTDGEELFVTIIDVTNGRRQFPRKTFSGVSAAALTAAIDGAELEVGDNKAFAASVVGDVVTITYPANVIAKIATNEDATTNESTPPALNAGLTNAQAIEFVGNKITKAGRTNRVGFPVIEPSVFQDLGLSTTANYDVLTMPLVSDVRFDKNVGASYQDVEYVTVLIADGATMTNS
jgi:hypothetical protein